MAVRTINFTQRKRIEHSDVPIVLLEKEGKLCFSASLSLKRYEFPGDSKVIVEAYRSARLERFDFGTVGNLQVPAEQELSQFSPGQIPRFRVKVVEKGTCKLNGQADQIRPRLPKEREEKRIALLVAELANQDEIAREEVWRLDFGNDGPPRLLFNPALRGRFRQVVRDGLFRALTMPSILRQVLENIYQQKERDEDIDPDDSDDWRSRWIRFARELTGTGLPNEESEVPVWIDRAVDALCKQNRFCSIFLDRWSEGEEQ